MKIIQEQQKSSDYQSQGYQRIGSSRVAALDKSKYDVGTDENGKSWFKEKSTESSLPIQGATIIPPKKDSTNIPTQDTQQKTEPVTKLPKKVDTNELIKNAWFSPLYAWTKDRNGQSKLYENGNTFSYTVYSQTTEEMDVFLFYKNGDLRYQHSDPSNTKNVINDTGKWVPNTGGVGFVVTMDNGDIFDSGIGSWKKNTNPINTQNLKENLIKNIVGKHLRSKL
jgi:hypothetical protein